MIKLLDVDVYDFTIWTGKLIYSKGTSLFNLSLYIEEHLLFTHVSDFSIYGNLLLVSTWQPSSYLFDLEENEIVIELNGYSCSPSTLTEEGFYISQKIEDKRKKYYFSLESSQITPPKKKPVYSDDNMITLYQDGRNLLYPESFAWKFKTVNPVEITKFIGVIEGIIFLALSDNNVLALDSLAGKEKWRINPDSYFDHKNQQEKVHSVYIKVDNFNKKLIHPLCEIDPNGHVTHSNYLSIAGVEKTQFWSINEKYGIAFTDAVFTFSAKKEYYDEVSKKPEVGNYLFIIDRITSRSVDIVKLNEGENYKAVKKVEIYRAKVYCLDFGNTLTVTPFKIDKF